MKMGTMKKLALAPVFLGAVANAKTTWQCGDFSVSLLAREFNKALTVNMLIKGKGIEVVGFPTYWKEGSVEHYRLEANETYVVTHDLRTTQRSLNGTTCQ